MVIFHATHRTRDAALVKIQAGSGMDFNVISKHV